MARTPRMGTLILAGCILALTFSGCTTTKQPKVTDAEIKAEQDRAKVEAFQTYRERSNKLHDVAYPLLVASAELTDDKTWSYGLVFDSLESFDKKDRELAQRAFPGLTKRLHLVYVVKGGPAESLDLQTGDLLLEYNGIEIDELKDFAKAVEKLPGDDAPGTGRFVFSRRGEKVEVLIPPKRIAAYKANLVADSKINASADGKSIFMTYGMMRFCEDDDELALVLGHELAHNTEGHVNKMRVKNIATMVPFLALDVAAVVVTGGLYPGGLSQIPMKAIHGKYSRDHEREADYVGTYIAARAGYDTDKAAEFWRRFSTEIPKDIKEAYDRTHPTSPERTVRMEKVVEEIIEKKSKRLPLLPERK